MTNSEQAGEQIECFLCHSTITGPVRLLSDNRKFACEPCYWRDHDHRQRKNISALQAKVADLEKDLKALTDNTSEILSRHLGHFEKLDQRIQALEAALKAYTDFIHNRPSVMDTYNGGYDSEKVEAFKHGMDTIFNCLEALRPVQGGTRI